MEEEGAQKCRRLMKTCENICTDGKINSGGFWELKKRIERKKKEEVHAVLNEKGELVTTHEEIRERYEEYYQNLLTTTNKRIDDMAEDENVKRVNEMFGKIMERGKKQEKQNITNDDIKEALSKLKKKKCKDSEGWNNEIMLEGGEEMISSLRKMTDQILTAESIPTQWQLMYILSIFKKGMRTDLSNQRGLFLTNVVSKLFEKVVEGKIGNVKFDVFQCGGTKGRATIDNWIVTMAVVDEGKRLKKNVYIFFADLVKCFDRLWLKDCLVDLHEAGAREKEIRVIYKLNETSKFKVITPAGITKEIVVEEVVKQGTVFGPKLCCATTGKVNEGNEMTTVIYPTVKVKALTFVDDIEALGSKEAVEETIKRCIEMEKTKLMEFSTEKSKWMCIKQGNNAVTEINMEVKQGKIGRTENYKYLGNYINEKGNMDTQLTYMEKIARDVIREGNCLCAKEKLGQAEFIAKRFIYEKVATMAVFHNVEAWTNMRQTNETYK